MKIRDITKKIRTDKMQIVTAGHRTNLTKERFLELFDRDVAMANGAHDDQWSARPGVEMATVNAQMREFHQRNIDQEVAQDEAVGNTLSEGDYCFGCGKTLKLVLTGDTLQLRRHVSKVGKDYEIVIDPPDFVCPFAEPKPYVGEITIASTMLFTNIFSRTNDAPKGKEHTPEYSLNCLAGRRKIADYKAKKNFAMGQMGNMSVGVFVHPDKKSIIIGDPYIEERRCEDMTDKEYKKRDKKALSMIEGHKMVGRISLQVWRWEATDLDTLRQPAYKKLKKDPYADLVEVDAKHGVWQYEHYYDARVGDWETIHSRFKLKETI